MNKQDKTDVMSRTGFSSNRDHGVNDTVANNIGGITHQRLLAPRGGAVAGLTARRAACWLTAAFTAFTVSLPAPATAQECPNAAVRASTMSENLPDCRGYEMVTPPAKIADPFPSFGSLIAGASDDGEHLFFDSYDSIIADLPTNTSIFRSDRGPAGWQTVAPLPKPPNAGPADVDHLLGFSSSNLSLLAEVGSNYDPSDTDSTFNAPDYYNFMPGGSFTFMSPNEVNPAPFTFEGRRISAASDDAQSIVFREGNEALLPVDLGRLPWDKTVYEFRHGQLRLVPVDNSGGLLTSGSVYPGGFDSYFFKEVSGYNAYSYDGSKIFFTTTSGGGSTDRVGLWVRLDGETTEPVPAAPEGANASSVFLGATRDGSKVFFASPLQLTPDDRDSSTDLYEYTLSDHSLRRISAGAAPAEVMLRPVWASEDGSRVYFTASGQLIAGQGSAGGPKTYLSDHGQLKLVADNELLVEPESYNAFSEGRPVCGPTRITPDGRYLLAQTAAALTTDDTDGGAQDVYRYDAVTGRTVRVSTGSADQNGPEGAFINSVMHMGMGGCDASFFIHLTHPMSDDGRFVFFETQAGLVPGDSNGRYDVYEWSAETGKTTLITSGADSDDSDLLDATPNGESVFFSTRAKLVGEDLDSSLDFYTARVGGGFPAPQPKAACLDSGCQGSAPAQPSFGVPGSLGSFASAAPAARPELKLGRLSAGALKSIARGGRVRIRVTPAVDEPLTLTATLRGAGGSALASAKTTVAAKAGHPVSLSVSLRAPIHRLLGRRRSVLLALTARQAGVPSASGAYVLHRAVRSGR